MQEGGRELVAREVVVGKEEGDGDEKEEKGGRLEMKSVNATCQISIERCGDVHFLRKWKGSSR